MLARNNKKTIKINENRKMKIKDRKREAKGRERKGR